MFLKKVKNILPKGVTRAFLISGCKSREDLYIGTSNARLKQLREDILKGFGNVPKNSVIFHRD